MFDTDLDFLLVLVPIQGLDVVIPDTLYPVEDSIYKKIIGTVKVTNLSINYPPLDGILGKSISV